MSLASATSSLFTGNVSSSWDPLNCRHCGVQRGLWISSKPVLPTSKRPGVYSKLRIIASFEKLEQQAGVRSVGNAAKSVLKLLADAFKAVQKPAVALLVIGLLMSQSPEDALAASGGRVGGRAFSSGGRSSQTYTMPGSGYRGGYSNGLNSGYRGGYSSGLSSGFSFSVPYAAPSPFYGGGLYFAPAYSVGFGGGAFMLMLLLGFVAFQLVSGFLVDRGEGTLLSAGTKTSVLKVQVGLLGRARSLQLELEQLASRADTSNPQGLHYVLTETVLSLMRHPHYCISGTSSAEVKRSVEAGEARFNQLSLEERGKFDEETLVSVDNIRKRSAPRARGSNFNNEYIVVSLLVAAQGDYKLPVINSNNDLKTALSKLGSIPADQIMAVEVLWTPQDENDALTERELLRDYPLLRPL